ncbi:transposase [Burkholderia gladioli]|uniref:transposase n=1 Tax=Burkholderia gladioli TaxID=28095 RepID=UPI001EE6401E|nr:transposase [Burkholderia gladioli]
MPSLHAAAEETSHKYPKAVETLRKNCDALLAFYGLLAEHWQRVRIMNPIESKFATARHRTSRTRNCLLRSTFLAMAFKLLESVDQPPGEDPRR